MVIRHQGNPRGYFQTGSDLNNAPSSIGLPNTGMTSSTSCMRQVIAFSSRVRWPYMSLSLGVTVKDKITEFSGIVTGRCEYITGCH